MLCPLQVGRKKKAIETAGGLFSQGQTSFAGCATQDFCCCYVQLKDDLRISL
jgi:hypothetical protein